MPNALVYKISRGSGEIRVFEGGETIAARNPAEITVTPMLSLRPEDFEHYRLIIKEAV